MRIPAVVCSSIFSFLYLFLFVSVLLGEYADMPILSVWVLGGALLYLNQSTYNCLKGTTASIVSTKSPCFGYKGRQFYSRQKSGLEDELVGRNVKLIISAIS